MPPTAPVEPVTASAGAVTVGSGVARVDQDETAPRHEQHACADEEPGELELEAGSDGEHQHDTDEGPTSQGRHAHRLAAGGAAEATPTKDLCRHYSVILSTSS